MVEQFVQGLNLLGAPHKRDSELKICFVIPASPTEAFYSQVAMFRFALDALGGLYKKTPIILSLGDETIKPIPERWLLHLGSNTILNWADPELFHNIGIHAQGDNRWKYAYDDYDVIILSDADIILLRPIDELLFSVRENNLVSGVIAHYPFPHEENEHSGELWHHFAKKITGKDIKLNFRYTLLKSEDQGKDTKCPFYVNFGFVLMTHQSLKAIRNTYFDMSSNLRPLLKDPRFSGQIALTLALHKHEIPVMSAPMAYNFPNDPIADKLYPDQLEQIRVMHYLRTEKFDRQKIFTTEEAFNEFLLLELEGSNKIFQEYIRAITHGRYPFKDPKGIPFKSIRLPGTIPAQTGQKYARTKKRTTKDEETSPLSRKLYAIFTRAKIFIFSITRLKNSGRLRHNLDLIKLSDLFDATWYLAKNPDVVNAKVDPASHYLNHGCFEGRDPSPKFNSQYYLASNTDVKNSGINPLLHYLKYGKKEGRLIQPLEEDQPK